MVIEKEVKKMKTLFKGQDVSIVLDDDTKTYVVYGAFLPLHVMYDASIRVSLKDKEINDIINAIKDEYQEVK